MNNVKCCPFLWGGGGLSMYRWCSDFLLGVSKQEESYCQCHLLAADPLCNLTGWIQELIRCLASWSLGCWRNLTLFMTYYLFLFIFFIFKNKFLVMNCNGLGFICMTIDSLSFPHAWIGLSLSIFLSHRFSYPTRLPATVSAFIYPVRQNSTKSALQS